MTIVKQHPPGLALMDISGVIRASSRLGVIVRKIKGESETTVIPRNVAIL